MEKLEYIPGDLVMTNGVPLGTAQNVVYRVTSSDPSKTLKLDDGTVLKGVVCLENYMPSCRACNFRKRDMTLEQFRAEIKRQAVGLLSGAAKFQVKMSIVYGLIIPQFDKKVVFYFEKVKRKD